MCAIGCIHMRRIRMSYMWQHRNPIAHMNESCCGHDSFICAIGCIHMCYTRMPYTWYSLICDIHMCHMRMLSYVPYEDVVYVIFSTGILWHMQMSHVEHDSFICAIGCIHMCYARMPYMWHSLICDIHMRHMRMSYMWHSAETVSDTCGWVTLWTWLIHMCHRMHSYVLC